MAHIETFDLAGVAGVLDAESRKQWQSPPRRADLPESGFLQVFHDLATYGYDAEDRSAQGWLIPWLPGRD